MQLNAPLLHLEATIEKDNACRLNSGTCCERIATLADNEVPTADSVTTRGVSKLRFEDPLSIQELRTREDAVGVRLRAVFGRKKRLNSQR